MRTLLGASLILLLAVGAYAQPISQQITAADTNLLFGGADAEGGIGDWYVSNGVVQAIIDDAGPVPDLVPILAPADVPPMQSEISPTGGTIIDLGPAGQDGDELPQLFTVGGLSTSFFILYDTVTAPSPGTVRATGKLLLPPNSPPSAPCIDVVTDYAALGSDPFLTVTSTQTNHCAVEIPAPTAFLDAITWTQRGIIPFSSGTGTIGGRGFDHPILDFANAAAAVEFPTFIGAPGQLREADGVMDPANGTLSKELTYGMLAVSVENDADGPGGADPVPGVANLFGVSSTLVTAMGVAGGAMPVGGSFTYVRRVYARPGADVRAVSDVIIPELATKSSFTTGTVSGDVDATDTPDVAATVVFTKLGACGGNPSAPCKTAAECTGGAACTDLQPATGFGPGGAVTQVRTDAAGKFSGVVLPRGTYEILVSAPERDDTTLKPIPVDTGDNPITIPTLPPRGLVHFRVREKAKGRPAVPAKLVFKGTAGTGTVDPRFHRDVHATLGGEDITPETFAGTQHGADGDARGQGNVVYTATGEGTIDVRPGTYDVYATRGPEYGVVKRKVHVKSGQTARVDFRLKRVIRTKNAIAADFHVHSGRSLDSSAPLEDRVASFAGEGVEVMISTDHDKQVDYTPVIASLGLGGRIATIPGLEVTGSVPNPPAFPNSIGHINAWPLPVVKDARRDGAIDDEYVAPNWVFSRLRAAGRDDVVIQYNHPRAGVSGLTSIGFFNSIGCGRCANAIDTTCTQDTDCPAAGDRTCTCVGFQPERPLSQAPNDILLDTGVRGPGTTANPNGVKNLDFDVMEIANGAKVGDYASYLQVRDDWFALLGQGMRKPGTGVSDSHRITVEHAGWSRSYVLGVGDDPASFDHAAFNRAVKAGRMTVSAGAFIQATIKGSSVAGPGDTVVSSTGNVRVKIDVRSPAWIPVDEVRIVTVRGFGASNVEVRTYDATTKPRVKPTPKNFQSSGGTSRFRGSIPIQYSSDYMVIVEAGPALGTAPTSPPIVNIIEPDVVPLGFTNPIFVDVGGDGFALPAAAAARTGPPAGRMTGVTRAARDAAIARGDYFPLHELVLDPVAIGKVTAEAVP
jgi:hypothetical protein